MGGNGKWQVLNSQKYKSTKGISTIVVPIFKASNTKDQEKIGGCVLRTFDAMTKLGLISIVFPTHFNVEAKHYYPYYKCLINMSRHPH